MLSSKDYAKMKPNLNFERLAFISTHGTLHLHYIITTPVFPSVYYIPSFCPPRLSNLKTLFILFFLLRNIDINNCNNCQAMIFWENTINYATKC